MEINGGRIGDWAGPERLRYHISRFRTVDKPDTDAGLTQLFIVDVGDIPADCNLVEALTIAYMTGKHPQVDLFDLSEYNPGVEEYRTGRLAAEIFYYFCFGVASRAEKK